MKKTKLILNAVVFCLLIVVISAVFVFSPDKEISHSERRPLMNFDEVVNPEGEKHAFDVFESYFLDQFPLRETFRKIKAFVYTDLLRRNDNNGIYKYDGTVIEIQKYLNEKQIEHALNVFDKVRKEYFENNKVYFSVIPDKHYYASKENGYPAMDYEKLFSMVKEGFDGAEYIDITELLELSDYYKTDSHWSQDKIYDVAQKLVSVMNSDSMFGIYKDKISVKSPFYGVYYGQSALTLDPDEIKYLENEMTDSMTANVIKPVLSATTFEWSVGETKQYPVYVEEMFSNNDPYDIFLAGPEELIVIDNPMAKNDKTLIVFRDSFGSSIGPLLAQGYGRTILVDLRYAVPDMISTCVEFDENADVLFLYSTGMYNSGATIRDFSKISSVKPDEKNEEEAEEITEENNQENPDETPAEETEENTEESVETEEESASDNPSEEVKTEEKGEPVVVPETAPEEAPSTEKTLQELPSGLMVYDGYVFEKNEYNKSNSDYAISLINKICERYLNGNNVYVSVVPDKNYQVMKQTGGSIDGYTNLVSSVKNGITSAKYIDILNMLNLDDYYKTDAHWKQENITAVANKLVSSMNSSIGAGYETSSAYEFSGTYLKSGKVDMPKEELKYLTNGAIRSMSVKALGMSGKFAEMPMYSADRMSGAEEYDFFLGGAQTIVTIENPSVQNGRELVVFRDSFGSSIAPLVAQGYSKTILVDIRYVVPDMLPNFVNFENCDVLFLYSSNILNNGRILKNFMR